VFLVLIRYLNEFSDSKLRVGSGKSFHAFTVEEENKAVFKSVHTFIIKSKRFTP
jgi:hypothetical protein